LAAEDFVEKQSEIVKELKAITDINHKQTVDMMKKNHDSQMDEINKQTEALVKKKEKNFFVENKHISG
jgi:hypothetical protein